MASRDPAFEIEVARGPHTLRQGTNWTDVKRKKAHMVCYSRINGESVDKGLVQSLRVFIKNKTSHPNYGV